MTLDRRPTLPDRNEATGASTTPSSNVRTIGRVLSGAALALTAMVSMALALLVTVGDVHFARILTESMAPDVNRGDALVLAPLSVHDITPGTVVLLPMPDANGTMYAHRVTRVERSAEGVTLHTKGDANPAADPWTVTVHSSEVQRVVTTLPLSDIPILQLTRSTIYKVIGLLVALFIAARVRSEVGYRRRRSAQLLTET
jgi:signal peptidase I